MDNLKINLSEKISPLKILSREVFAERPIDHFGGNHCFGFGHVADSVDCLGPVFARQGFSVGSEGG